MAVAKVEIRCPECGKLFVRKAIKGNRRDADSWEAWAVSHPSLCPDCYKQAMADEAAAKAAALAKDVGGFPLLSGSEKQIAYATSLRARYAANSLSADTLRVVAAWRKEFEAWPEEQIAKLMEQTGADSAEAAWLAAMNQHKHNAVAWVVLHENNAGKVIEALRAEI